ncbi:MAG: class I SAM-dependent methyltransferase, partial [Isosphaeraceae bacterium]
MSGSPTPPSWKLPRGVNPALWRYAQSRQLAEREDHYFAGHPLFQADREALEARFVEPGPLIDLGCGAGRLSLGFAVRGFPVTAVELSQAMLEVVGDKARDQG